MWENAAHTPVFENVDRDFFENHIIPLHKPAILKGFVASWAAVSAASKSPAELCDYFKQYANHKPVKAWFADATTKGRFFYSEDIRGRNFENKQLPVTELLDQLLATQHQTNAPHLYAGAIYLPDHLPKLDIECPMNLLDTSRNILTSLWIGNQTRTAAHWDLPQNLACVIAGRRRFTLFPIEQLSNLYFGPIDNTLAGQSTSLVDFHNPDFEKFPGFKEAIKHAEIAELEPGDVLYMPSLCIHHVESLDSFGAMMNFWWRDAATYMPSPLYTLVHALLTLKGMPDHEKIKWQSVFNHYIFNSNEISTAHIPEAARGILGELTPEQQRQIKNFVLQTVNH